MPFDWKGYLDLARTVNQLAAAAAEPEPLQRSAVSRAYFGAFCHARNYAIDFLGYDPRDDHGRLRAYLAGKRRKGDADRLQQLRLWRNDADYLNELIWNDIPLTVGLALDLADRVFQSLAAPKNA